MPLHKCPAIRLQDLTSRDVGRYVAFCQYNEGTYWIYAVHDDKVALYIVTEIVEKSSRVFLWVKLVVRLILEGAADGDSMSGLREMVNKLPDELEDSHSLM
jgi:hypothetical protein